MCNPPLAVKYKVAHQMHLQKNSTNHYQVMAHLTAKSCKQELFSSRPYLRQKSQFRCCTLTVYGPESVPQTEQGTTLMGLSLNVQQVAQAQIHCLANRIE